MQISDWAAPVVQSWPSGAQEPSVGATRVCRIAPFGPFKAGLIKERLIRFDQAQMSFAYEATEGMPRFVAHAVNRWNLQHIDAHRARLVVHATLELRGPVRAFAYLLKWQMQRGGARVAAELKHFVENGTPHPRKLAAKRCDLPD